MSEHKDDHARRNALNHLETIQATFAAVDDLHKGGGPAELEGWDYDDEEALYERLREMALSVEVRSCWHTPGEGATDPHEYRILLTWGGPACQVCGNLSDHGEPVSAEIQFQDWFTPWETCSTDSALLRFAQLFYFGG